MNTIPAIRSHAARGRTRKRVRSTHNRPQSPIGAARLPEPEQFKSNRTRSIAHPTLLSVRRSSLLNTVTPTNTARIIVLAAAAIALALPVQGSEWTLSIGPAVRTDLKLRIEGPSHAQPGVLALPRAAAPSSTGALLNVPADDILQYRDRTFDDGFVFIDPSTVDFGGDTWFWGYRDADQYDAARDTLTFRRAANLGARRTVREQRSSSVFRNDALAYSQTLDAEGVSLSLSRAGVQRERWSLSIATGARGFWGLDAAHRQSTFEQRARVTRETTTERRSAETLYTYDLLGVVPPPPPYEGTFDGPGPLLPNLPAYVETGFSGTQSSERLVVSDVRYVNQIAVDVEVDLYEFWIGPQLAVQPHKRVAVLLTPYVGVTFVDGEADRREDVEAIRPNGSRQVVRTWRDRSSASDWHFGAGAMATLRCFLADHGFLGIGAGYAWVSSDYNANVGPSRLTLELSGFQAEAEIGWTF